MDALTRFTPGRSRPPAATTDDDDEWDALIARAKMRAASLGGPLRLQPPAAGYASRTSPMAPRARPPERTGATLDALMRGGLHSAASLRPVLAPRLPEEEMVTPPPVPKPPWAGPGSGATRRR